MGHMRAKVCRYCNAGFLSPYASVPSLAWMGLSVARNKEARPISYHIRAGPAKKRRMVPKALLIAPSLLRVRT